MCTSDSNTNRDANTIMVTMTVTVTVTITIPLALPLTTNLTLGRGLYEWSPVGCILGAAERLRLGLGLGLAHPQGSTHMPINEGGNAEQRRCCQSVTKGLRMTEGRLPVRVKPFWVRVRIALLHLGDSSSITMRCTADRHCPPH